MRPIDIRKLTKRDSVNTDYRLTIDKDNNQCLTRQPDKSLSEDELKALPVRDALVTDKRLTLDSANNFVMTNQPDNSAIGTAASKDVGTAQDQIETNALKDFKSFDSLTSAVAYVTANPDNIKRLDTASYRNESECLALSIEYPDGGGADYVVVPSGTGTDDGSYFIDAGSKQLFLSARRVNSRQVGIVGNGVVDDSNTIASAGSGAGAGASIVFLAGTYNLDSDAWIASNTVLFFDKGTLFTGAGTIKGNRPASWGAVGYAPPGGEIIAKSGRAVVDTFNDGGVAYLSNYFSLIRGGTPTKDTETDIVRIEGETSQLSGVGELRGDLVGLHATVRTAAGNTNGRLFGLNPYIDIPAGTDALANGIEVNIANFGSDVPVIGSQKAKYAFNATCEHKKYPQDAGFPATAAYRVAASASPDEAFWTCFWAGENSVVNDPAAQFIEFDKQFAVNRYGKVGVGVEYSHADFTMTLNGDGDYKHPDYLTNPEQYGQVVSPSMGYRHAKILLNAGQDKDSFISYSVQLAGSIYSAGVNSDTGKYSVCLGTSMQQATELLTVNSSGTLQLPKSGVNILNTGQVQIGSATSLAGSGGACIIMKEIDTPPTQTAGGQGILYVQDGQLMFKGSAGTVTVIAPQ